MRVAECARWRQLFSAVGIVVGLVVGSSTGAAAAALPFAAHTMEGTSLVVRWSCGTHPVYASGLSETAHSLLADAVTQLRNATGIEFVLAGPPPDSADIIDGAIVVRAVDFPDDRPTPGTAARISQDVVYTGAVVRLNTDVQLDARYTMNVLLHELGHAVGLDHIDSYESIMSGLVLTGGTTYTAGDLQGLATVGCQEPSIH